jgi:hypothetical protein
VDRNQVLLGFDGDGPDVEVLREELVGGADERTNDPSP